MISIPAAIPGAAGEVRRQVYGRTEELLAAGHRRNDTIGTADDLRRRQEELRAWCAEAIGGWPTPRSAPVAVTTAVTERDAWRAESVLLGDSTEGHLTGALYRPTAEVGDSGGAVLFLCGHAPDGKAALPYQDFCQRLAGNGLTVLVVDTVGQGERLSYLDGAGGLQVPDNVQEHTYAGIQCWWVGDTLARHLVVDACRALDFLTAVAGVDPARIGVAGNSGGGTMATWLMMGEPRIAAAAPGCFVTSRHSYLWTDEGQDPEQILVGGAAAGIDHEDFLLAMAPRPTLVMSAEQDFFPVEGARWSVGRARRYFDVAGAPDQLEHVLVEAGHGMHPGLARAAAEFFVRHLGDGREVDHSDPVPLDESALQATVSGQVRLDQPTTPLVYEHNLGRYASAIADRDRTDRDPAAVVRWLSERVSNHRQQAIFRPTWGPPQSWGHAGATLRTAVWDSEPGVRVAGHVLAPAEGDGATTARRSSNHGPTVLALFDRGSVDLSAHADRCLDWVAAGRTVVVLDVRGIGAVRMAAINDFPYEGTYGTAYKLMTDLFWLGDSLAAARVHDVARTIAQLDRLGLASSGIQLYGAGHGAFYSLLAAALAPTVAHLEVDGPLFDPESVVTTRLYPPGRDQQLMIPGMAVQAPVADLIAAVRARGATVVDS